MLLHFATCYLKAERGGFEPPIEGLAPITVFETAAFDHSATSPVETFYSEQSRNAGMLASIMVGRREARATKILATETHRMTLKLFRVVPCNAVAKYCGAERDRTADLYVANVPLSQLSYCPIG